jgi:hypothetical protein
MKKIDVIKTICSSKQYIMESWCKIKVNNTYLQLNSRGDIKRLMKSGNWKIIPNLCNHNNGMNVIMIDSKQYTRSKIFGCVYYGLNINNSYICKFKDKNRMNCNINNLQFINQ